VKKSITALAVSLAFVFVGAPSCGNDITPGGACDQVGSKHTNKDGYAYTCQQVPGGNRIWQQDAPLTPDRP
jgi:hypothetical protein